MSNNAIIQAENLTKKFGDKIAVDHISFSVAEGEIFGFLGPNGAGKTTTIRILTTLASLTEGRATVAGIDVTKHPSKVRSNIGVVPQQLTADNELKGIENLLLTARLQHVPREEARRDSRRTDETRGPAGVCRKTSQDILWRHAAPSTIDFGACTHTENFVSGRADPWSGHSDTRENVGIHQAPESGQRSHRVHDNPLSGRSGFSLQQDRNN